MKITKIDNVPSVVFIILIISQFFPGIDLTHHLATTRLYHDMLVEGQFLLKHQNLLGGEQSTITYGIPFYVLGGIIWPVFDRFTIDFVMGLITLFSFLMIRRIAGTVGYQTASLILLWGFIIPDSYIAYCANVFLWLTAYLYLQNNRYYQVSLALAFLTHPFSLIVGFYYAYKERKNSVLIGVFLTYYLIITFMFTAQGSIPLPNMINTLIARVAIGIFPILLHTDLSSKLIRVVSICLVTLVCISNCILFLLVEPLQLRGLYEKYQTLFNGLPPISGTMRVIDYDYLPSAYFLPQKGLVLSTGSFFESWIPQTRSKWSGMEEYGQHMENHRIDYVLMCTQCGTIFPGAHPSEKAILSSHYPVVWHNEYYTLYRNPRRKQTP